MLTGFSSATLAPHNLKLVSVGWGGGTASTGRVLTGGKGPGEETSFTIPPGGCFTPSDSLALDLEAELALKYATIVNRSV